MADLVALGALLVAAFAGGAFGAAVGGLRALGLAGLAVAVGEVATVAGEQAVVPLPYDPGLLGAVGLTGSVGLGPFLGPHVAFAGGLAAAAYAGRSGHPDPDHAGCAAKDVARSLGTAPDVLAVGGTFGVVGLLLARTSAALALPWDPIAASVVASGLLHRLAFGYPLLGAAPRDSRGGDASPLAEGGERRVDGGAAAAASPGPGPVGRPFVVPRELSARVPLGGGPTAVGLLGAAVGAVAAAITYATGSPLLAFGLAGAALAGRTLGADRVPATHHMALPAGVAVVGLAGFSDPSLADGTAVVAPAALASALTLPLALAAGAFLGLLGGLLGRVAERAVYLDGYTHLDPPAVSLLGTSLLLALLDVVGLLAQGVYPTPL